jgi:hypothetical protein
MRLMRLMRAARILRLLKKYRSVMTLLKTVVSSWTAIGNVCVFITILVSERAFPVDTYIHTYIHTYIPLRNCLFTPEFQWQSRGE